jgi:hypothetical protein
VVSEGKLWRISGRKSKLVHGDRCRVRLVRVGGKVGTRVTRRGVWRVRLRVSRLLKEGRRAGKRRDKKELSDGVKGPPKTRERCCKGRLPGMSCIGLVSVEVFNRKASMNLSDLRRLQVHIKVHKDIKSID